MPLNQASVSGNRIEVPFERDKVKDAPGIEPDGELSPTEEDRLYTYYGLGSSSGRLSGQTSEGTTTTDRDAVGHDTSGPTTDDAMTRSEERLVADTRTEQVGRARLRKYVVTEEQQVTVPVTREEVRLEREPITDANLGDAMAGPDITEAEHEVTLHADRPVLQTETVPVERVRLNKETVRDEETVTGQVRKEQIELDDDTAAERAAR